MREILHIEGASVPGMSSFNCVEKFRNFVILDEVVIFVDDKVSKFLLNLLILYNGSLHAFRSKSNFT